MVNRCLKAAVAAIFCAGAGALPAAEPFNFDYVIEGPEGVRPRLVFSDGRDTWIHPMDGVETRVLGMPAQRQGPYIVVRGLPYRIAVAAGGQTLMVARADAPPMTLPAAALSAPPACADERLAVPFPRLRSAPDGATQRALEKAADLARGAVRVVVTGRPDSRSERLAKARAERAREGLILRGVPASRVETRVELAPRPGWEAEVSIEAPCGEARAPAAGRGPWTAWGPAGGGAPGPMPGKAWTAAPPGAPAGDRIPQPSAPGLPAPRKEEPAASGAAARDQSGPAPAQADGRPAGAPSADRAGEPPMEAAGTPDGAGKDGARTAALVVRQGERLSQALGAFLARHGVALKWLASTDLEASRETRIELADWKRTVAYAAAAAGYSAVLVKETNTLYVRDARPTHQEEIP